MGISLESICGSREMTFGLKGQRVACIDMAHADIKRRHQGRARRTFSAKSKTFGVQVGDTRGRSFFRSRRNIGLILCVGLTLLGLGGFLESGRRFFIRRIRILGQSAIWTEGWTLIDSGSYKTWKRAQKYYNTQLPIIRAQAKNYSVNSYFASVGPYIKTEKVGWYEIIGFRAKIMASMLEEQHRDDFKVEKDKCVMMGFFQKNKFPMPKVLKVWRVKQDTIRDLKQDSHHLLEGTEYPVFLKCCHLTQGSSKSTIAIKSPAQIRRTWSTLLRWINIKWDYRSDDWERPWAKDMNKLTDSLLPGFLLQSPFIIPKGEGVQFMELKVEVLYGRAYLAVANEPYKGTILTRDGVIETYPTLYAQITNSATLNPPETKWVQEEGHLLKVWEMAERAAKIMGVDEVRIDVFIRRGDPNGLAINENSLSSGMGYRMHFKFLAQVWAEGHLKKWYKTYDNSIPVYQQTEQDSPNFKIQTADPA